MRDAVSMPSSSIDTSVTMRSLETEALTPKETHKIIRWCYRMAELTLNMRRHLRVHRALSGAGYKEIRKLQPQIFYKYINRRYLVSGLTSSARASAQEHHYRFMKRVFSDHFLKNRLISGVRLWKQDEPEGHHELLLSFSHPCDNEGELTLFYNFAGVSIARGSFTFVPADLVGEDTQTSLLITRLQGEKNVHEHVRHARKSLQGLDGPAIIVACLVGIAQTLRLNSISIVSAEAQVSRTNENFGTLQAAYDGFCLSIGAESINEKFLRLSLPLSEKPLSEVKSSNRKKVTMQRLIKNSVAAATAEEFTRYVLRPHQNRLEYFMHESYCAAAE